MLGVRALLLHSIIFIYNLFLDMEALFTYGEFSTRRLPQESLLHHFRVQIITSLFFQANPTSFSLISHIFLAFSTSLASCESWFSKEAESLFQLQYTPDLVRLGSLTT